MNSEFAGKAVIVTGATSGIGQHSTSICAVRSLGSRYRQERFSFGQCEARNRGGGRHGIDDPADLTIAAEATRIVSLPKRPWQR